MTRVFATAFLKLQKPPVITVAEQPDGSIRVVWPAAGSVEGSGTTTQTETNSGTQSGGTTGTSESTGTTSMSTLSTLGRVAAVNPRPVLTNVTRVRVEKPPAPVVFLEGPAKQEVLDSSGKRSKAEITITDATISNRKEIVNTVDSVEWPDLGGIPARAGQQGFNVGDVQDGGDTDTDTASDSDDGGDSDNATDSDRDRDAIAREGLVVPFSEIGFKLPLASTNKKR